MQVTTPPSASGPWGPTARLATVSHDDMPADVIALVTVGKKVRAIKRYRKLTGVSLRKAKATIDSI